MKVLNQKGKPRFLFNLVWAAPHIAAGIIGVILTFVNYYCTNVLGMDPKLVGSLLLGASVFDGFTDIIAGYLIDKTKTRFGKGRPFDFAYAGFLIFTMLFFCNPRFGEVGTAVYVFVIYCIIFTVFQTLYSCADPVYLARAVENDQHRISVSSLSGLLTTLVTMIFTVVMPQFIDWAGSSVEKWRIVVFATCIPCLLPAVIRFFLIKETGRVSEQVKTDPISIRTAVKLLFSNKFVLLFGLALLFTNIGSNMSQAFTYYFQYVYCDVKAMSTYTIGMVFGPLTLVLIPVLTKKMSLRNVLAGALALGVIGKLLPLINNQMPMLLISSVFGGIAYIPIYMMAGNVLIQCMDYGEWKSGVRGEGIYSCVSGFCSKVGKGMAAWVIGIVTAMGGFSGTLEVQPASAISAINLLFTIIPAVFYALAVLVLQFYTLEKKLPAIREELNHKA